MEDSKRISKILDELSARYNSKINGLQITMDEKASKMLMEYTTDLTASLIEASIMMARHRNSKSVDPDDVYILLNKKLGIELPGYENMKLQQSSSSHTTSSVPNNVPSGSVSVKLENQMSNHQSSAVGLAGSGNSSAAHGGVANSGAMDAENSKKRKLENLDESAPPPQSNTNTAVALPVAPHPATAPPAHVAGSALTNNNNNNNNNNNSSNIDNHSNNSPGEGTAAATGAAPVLAAQVSEQGSGTSGAMADTNGTVNLDNAV
jgi:histone H3/H4